MHHVRLASLVLCLFAASAHALQQPDASFTWVATLQDSRGAPIVGAAVRAESGPVVLSSRTDAKGQFTLGPLRPGAYVIRAEVDGRSAATPSLLILSGTGPGAILEWTAEGELRPGAARVREGTGGEQLSGKAVSELPLNKRDFSQLLLLAAGTMTDTSGASNFTQQFAVNGQRGTAAVFAMDGVDSSDPEMGGATFTNFNVDAVQEIQSNSGWMPAEIGRGAAGFNNIVTRSGSNSIHGSAFEFLRNSALDARNFFDRRSIAQPERIPPFRRNEFGVTNGGPVVIPKVYDGRGKTFYFGQYQGFRQVLGTTQVFPVPSADERAGLDTTAFAGDTLYVPVDSRIAPLIARYPMPNDMQGPYGPRTYATSSKVSTVSDQFSGRIDHAISDKSRLFARFTRSNISGPTTNPSQTAIDESFGVRYIDHQRNAALTFTHTASPNFVSESSLSFTRTTPEFPTPNRTDQPVAQGGCIGARTHCALHQRNSVTSSISRPCCSHRTGYQAILR